MRSCCAQYYLIVAIVVWKWWDATRSPAMKEHVCCRAPGPTSPVASNRITSRMPPVIVIVAAIHKGKQTPTAKLPPALVNLHHDHFTHTVQYSHTKWHYLVL